MNIFAVLDVSDDEVEVKKTTTKKTKETGNKSAPVKSAEAKPAKETKPAKDAKPQQENKQKDGKKPQAAATPAGEDDNFAGKENHKREKTNRYNDKRTGTFHEGKRRNPEKVGNERNSNVSKRVHKNGSGQYGTGNVENEALDAEKNPEAALEAAVPAEEGEQQQETVDAVEEVVDTTLTFDDYLRKRNEARSANDLFAPAKATRTVESTVFAGLKPVGELEDTYIAPKNAKTSQAAKKDQRSTGKAQVVDVAFKFESTAPEYRRRDDNRGERRPKTTGRGERKPASAALSSGDFPSL